MGGGVEGGGSGGGGGGSGGEGGGGGGGKGGGGGGGGEGGRLGGGAGGSVQQPLHEQPMSASWLHVPKALTFKHVDCKHGLRQGSVPVGVVLTGLGGKIPVINEPEPSQNRPQSL